MKAIDAYAAAALNAFILRDDIKWGTDEPYMVIVEHAQQLAAYVCAMSGHDWCEFRCERCGMTLAAYELAKGAA